MTALEYLSQAYRLDDRINSYIAEASHLRKLACSVGSPGYEEKHDPNHPTEAPFVRTLEKLWQMEEKINSEIDRLVDLKEQMRKVIETVPDPDERMVLYCRYIRNMSWNRIGNDLKAERTTVYRWHKSALSHIKLPENPILI